mmetsp:Transcript_15749/g.59937  ORF Transcript_15749/g.59937 Transcript_15749/m.59937 type:complete len:221 (+) Transcript_15749:1031-1693(+)
MTARRPHLVVSVASRRSASSRGIPASKAASTSLSSSRNASTLSSAACACFSFARTESSLRTRFRIRQASFANALCNDKFRSRCLSCAARSTISSILFTKAGFVGCVRSSSARSCEDSLICFASFRSRRRASLPSTIVRARAEEVRPISRRSSIADSSSRKLLDASSSSDTKRVTRSKSLPSPLCSASVSTRQFSIALSAVSRRSNSVLSKLVSRRSRSAS